MGTVLIIRYRGRVAQGQGERCQGIDKPNFALYYIIKLTKKVEIAMKAESSLESRHFYEQEGYQS